MRTEVGRCIWVYVCVSVHVFIYVYTSVLRQPQIYITQYTCIVFVLYTILTKNAGYLFLVSECIFFTYN